MKFKKKIFIVYTIIIIFIVALIGYCFFTVNYQNKGYTNVLGYTYLVDYDEIVFVKVTDDIRKNDVFYYKDSNNKFNETKLVGINNGSYITSGEKINKNQIIGKTVFRIYSLFVYAFLVLLILIYIIFVFVNRKAIFSKEKKKVNSVLPDSIFRNSSYDDNQVTGLTVTISLKDLEKAKENDVELLDVDDGFGNSDYDEVMDIVVSVLKCKNKAYKSKINSSWLLKYQYVYKLSSLLFNNNYQEFIDDLGNPPFKESYNYDLEREGLTKVIRNKIYNLPINNMLWLLFYSILYNDSMMFDGIYKILKYKVKIDRDREYVSDKRGNKKIKELIEYMRRIANKFDSNNVFELDKIDKLIKINNY